LIRTKDSVEDNTDGNVEFGVGDPLPMDAVELYN
jgi:hypothetical protein